MRVEYRQTPPQVFVSRMNKFIQENQPPNFTVRLRWESLGEPEPETEPESEQEVDHEGIALVHIETVHTYNMHVIR